MNNEVNFAVGDQITWINGNGQTVIGTVFERVRGKSRPKYEGSCCTNEKSKRNTSYIATYKSRRYWVDAAQMVLPQTKKQPLVKPVQKTSPPPPVKTAKLEPAKMTQANKIVAKPSVMAKPVTQTEIKTRTYGSTVRAEPDLGKKPRFGLPDAFKHTFDALHAYRRPCTSL